MRLLNEWIVCLVCVLLFATCPSAGAEVQVSIAKELQAGRHFLVDTKIFYGGIHGSHARTVDSSFLSAGEVKGITVLAVIPFIYGSIVASVFHPAYYASDYARSDKMPFVLRTITLDTLKPVSWRSLLDSGAPLRQGRVGIRAGDVNDHFGAILRHYLPAFDRARLKEDLRLHIPLLRELAAFAHSAQALKNSKLAMAHGSPGYAGQYDEAVERTEASYRRALDQRLIEIEGWLALPQERRRLMHDLMENFHKAEYVYRELMDDSDRRQMVRLLEQSGQTKAQNSVAWTNSRNGIHYSFALNARSSDGHGYQTDLTVNLNPLLGAKDDQWYLKRSSPNFSKGKDGVWRMQ